MEDGAGYKGQIVWTSANLSDLINETREGDKRNKWG